MNNFNKVAFESGFSAEEALILAKRFSFVIETAYNNLRPEMDEKAENPNQKEHLEKVCRIESLD